MMPSTTEMTVRTGIASPHVRKVSKMHVTPAFVLPIMNLWMPKVPKVVKPRTIATIPLAVL